MTNSIKSVSIIIRTKNEAKWIGSCLRNILNQEYHNKKEIIVVDNNSNDETREIVKKYKVKLINYNPNIYLPGLALNKAVKIAKNEIVVFLSAHCIPTSKNWLKNLTSSFVKNTVAVYGRQLPYSFSSFNDKRDLFNQFGIEKRIQHKDNFFHNANSAIIRKIIKKHPFNNKVKHIEDRIWAKNILKKNFNIVYEPKASVWHYHGLNHSTDTKRSIGVGKILENFVVMKSKNTATVDKTHNLLTIISHNPSISNKNFLTKFNKFNKKISKKNILGKVCVVSHSIDVVKKINKKFSAQAFLFKNKNTITIKKIKFGLNSYQKINKIIVDAVLILDIDTDLKNTNDYKKLFEKYFSDNYDTVIPIVEDYDMYWKKYSDNQLIRLDDADKLIKDKEPLYKSLSTIATVTGPKIIYNEKRLGFNIGCIIIK
mgnify:CR=1 FL=1